MSRCEQKAVYAAQNALHFHGRQFHSLEEITDYLSFLMDTDWFCEQFGYSTPITVQRMESNNWAGAANINENIILINQMHEPVVLHELAHLICVERGHGPAFITTFLILIRKCMGFYAWAEFKTALNKTEEFKYV